MADSDSCKGWVLGFGTQERTLDPIASPPVFRYLRLAVTCRGCVAGMPPSSRCTTDVAALQMATLDELLAGSLVGVCEVDRDDEIGRRLGRPNYHVRTTSRRPGLLERLHLRRPPS